MLKSRGVKMTAKSCPNSINKFRKIYLHKITYPNDNFESWYLTADEVAEVYKQGEIPEILIDEISPSLPKIALILALEKHPERQESDYSIHPDYVDAVLKAGGYPVFVAYDKVKEQLENLNPDGILLIGGDFAFPPEWYQAPPVNQTSKRAQAYLEICTYAREHHLPTLGICAGHQILAGFFNGKLRCGINNGLTEKQSHRRGGYILAHSVNIVRDSLLFKILNKEKLIVNTAHNEEVTRENLRDFKIVATADDGIIEAIEPYHPWHPFVLGVQWHPERLVKLGDADSLNIFKALIKVCKHDR